jgi:hypothetical protein
LRRVFDLLTRPRHYPWLAVAIAALLLLPCLGSHGFWEPREIGVADAASRWLEKRKEAKSTSDKGDEARSDARRPADEDTEPEEQRGGSKLVGSAAGEPGVPEPAPETGRGKLVGSAAGEPGVPDPTPEPAPRPPKAKPTPVPAEPRFTERLVAYGIDRLGFAEGGARAPLALLGLIAVMAAFLLGARAGGRRAGFVAAMVLVSFPLLILQARQLTSEIATATGSALLVLGLVGLARPPAQAGRGWERGAVLACDVVFIAAGGLLALQSGGPLLGLVPPLVGVGLGALVWAATERSGSARMHVVAVGGLALAAGLAAFAWFMHDAFTITSAGDDDRQLFGRTLTASRDVLPGLGGVWKIKGDPQTPFTAIFEQLGFGMFPWVALAPLAIVRLALGRGGSASDADAGGTPSPTAPAWIGYALFLWAALAWLVATIAVRKVGPVQYPAIVAVAVAIGIWIDEILTARAARQGDAAAEGPAPLLALFGLFAVAVIGRDLVSLPEKLTSLTAAGVKFPDGARIHWLIAPFAVLFAGALTAGLFLWRGPYSLRLRGKRDLAAGAGRWGLHAAVAVGVLFAGFLAYAWIPSLAGRMSSRDVLEVYRQTRQSGDELGILGNLGTGPSYYAGGDYEKLSGRSDLVEFLGRSNRVFALTRAAELCPLHKDSARKGFTYHVLDDRNVQFLLFSNKLGPGEVDQNPLARAIRRTPPAQIRHKLSVNFDDQIELIGVDMPQRVGRGDKFEMTLYYKVLKSVSRPWKIFVHLNAPGAPANINGDHAPIRGRCSMSYFQPGDYIVDTFEVKAGDMSFPKSNYRVFTGFFVGSSGNYTNMKALSGNPDENNRVPIGTIQVR